MSFINAAKPSVVDLIVDFGPEIEYHPTLSMAIGQAAQDIFRTCATGEKGIDIFVYEGTVIEGPSGSGRSDMFAGRPMKDWMEDMASKAGIVFAIGDIATYGGLPAVPPNPSDSRGPRHTRSRVTAVGCSSRTPVTIGSSVSRRGPTSRPWYSGRPVPPCPTSSRTGRRDHSGCACPARRPVTIDA
jgi:hydrogenase small subunit